MKAESKKARISSLVEDLRRKQTAEKKRQEDIVNFRNQITSMESDLQDLINRGIYIFENLSINI